jgi:hypothetical protein
VDKTTQNRLVYELAKEPFLIEELQVEKHLPATTSYNDSLAERVREREEIPLEFYGSEAMINHRWTNAEQRQRHVVTRYAVHGFHYKICKKKDFQRATENCICMLCGHSCGLYHLEVCEKRTKSLTSYSGEDSL